jgi:hypothetical protein
MLGGQQPHRTSCAGQSRRHQLRQQERAFGQDQRPVSYGREVLDDHVEPLGGVPNKMFHPLLDRRGHHPGLEIQPSQVSHHRVCHRRRSRLMRKPICINGIEPKIEPVRQPTSHRGLPGTASATKPQHMI